MKKNSFSCPFGETSIVLFINRQLKDIILKDKMENINPESLFRKAQALGEDIKEMESINVLAAYGRAQSTIKRKEKKSFFYNRLMRYAAILALPLFMSSLVLGYLYFSGSEADEKYVEVTAATGSIIRYELPDQSVVWLNAGSTLRYPTVFRKDNRTVELKGEAYFEVQANKKRPFYVNAGDGLSVYVYGTKFNVCAYEEDNTIETVLEKGMVNVLTPNQETIVLNPGEQLLYDKQTRKSVKHKVDVYGKVAWKEGKLIFRDASLADIFKRLERHFNVDIRYNNQLGKEYKYRATFRNETLAQILDYLAQSAALKWKIEESEQQADGTLSKTKIIVDLY